MSTKETNALITYIPQKSLHTFTVFPEDLNYAGSLFGGKLLAEMDISAIKSVRRMLYHTDCDAAVTASVEKVNFEKPAYLGVIIDLTAQIISVGKTSIKVKVEVQKEDKAGKISKICEAKFVFVSIKERKPFPHYTVLALN